MTVTFFGHRDAPSLLIERIRETVENLITEQKADRFIVGNNGNFDRMATAVLQEAQMKYPHINCYTVLAYMPNRKEVDKPLKTMIFDDIESVPKKYAIIYRNRWMIEQSDIVITYIKRNFGGAAQFAALAEKKDKIRIEIS